MNPSVANTQESIRTAYLQDMLSNLRGYKKLTEEAFAQTAMKTSFT